MSWEDLGRQEHGWFGHGTAPPKDAAGGSEAEQRRPDAASSADAAAARAYTWAKAYGPVPFPGRIKDNPDQAHISLDEYRKWRTWNQP